MLPAHINLFGVNCQIANSLNSVVVHWDTKCQQLRVPNNFPSKQRILTSKCIFHALLVILMVLQGLFHFTLKPNFSLEEKLLFGICVVHVGVPHIHLQVCRVQGPHICQFVNSVLRFYKQNTSPASQKKLTMRDRLDLLFAYAVTPFTFASMITNLFVLHWNNPYKPSLVGYWLLQVGSETKITSSLGFIWNSGIKIAIFALNFWIWMFALNVTTFVLSGFQALCVIMSLREFVKIFLNISLNSKISPRRGILIYRSIQVLATLANEIQQWGFIGAILFGGILFQALCASTVTQLPWTEEYALPLLILSIITLNSMFTILIIVGGMGTVLMESKRALGKLTHRLHQDSSGEAKWKRKFYASCSLLKIKFGSINYVDQLTPLNCIDFANCLTVQLLLLK